MKKSKIMVLVFSLLMLVSPGHLVQSTYANESDVQKNTVTIMHTNDMHGRFGTKALGLAHIKTLKNQINPLLMVDGGDAFQGLPISNVDKGAGMAQIMNAVGYDAMVVGNHEFDFGTAVALGKEEGFGQILDFPLLSVNTIYTEDQKQVFKASEMIEKPNSHSTLIEKQGYKIAVMGATTPETQTKTHPKNIEGISWKDPIPMVIEEMTKDAYKDADIFVVLTHLGIDNETKVAWRSDTLAKTLSENAQTKDKKILIVDGHSHTPIEEGIHVGDNVVLVQTGEHLNNVGVVTLNLDDFKSSTAELISLKETDIEPDPDILDLIKASDASYAETTSAIVVDNNPINFNGQRDFVRVQETNLGNIITDAMVAYGKEGFKNPTDFAVVNGGGIRADLKAGPLTLGDVISVLPFGNVMSQISVSGQQVWDMFEFSLRTDVQEALDHNGLPKLGSNGGFLHVSDTIRIHFDPTKEAFNRVLEIDIYDATQDTYLPVDLTKTYHMATNDFLAAGGDGYTMLGGPREEGPSLDTVFAEFLENNPAIDWNVYNETLNPQRILAMLEKDYVIPQEPILVTENLVKAMEKAKEIDPTVYTEESYQTLSDAIEKAESLLSQLSKRVVHPVTQDDIDSAVQAIDSALANLKPKDVVAIEKPSVSSKQPVDNVKTNVSKTNTATLPKTGIVSNSFYGFGATLSMMGWMLLKRNHRK